MLRKLACCLLLCCLLSGHAMAEAPKPILEVWGTATTSEQAFWQDFRNQPAFREALEGAFEVRRIETSRFPAIALCRGVSASPTFVIPGRGRLCGYFGTDRLLSALGIAGRVEGSGSRVQSQNESQQSPPSSLPTPDLNRLKSDLAKALQESLDQAEKRILGSTDARIQKNREEFLTQARDLAEQLKATHQSIDGTQSQAAATFTLVQGFEKQLAAGLAQLHERLNTPAPAPAVSPSPEPELVPWWRRPVSIFGAVLSLGQIAGAVATGGGSIGISAAVIYAWRAFRAVKSLETGVRRPEENRDRDSGVRIQEPSTLNSQRSTNCPNCKQLRERNYELTNEYQRLVGALEVATDARAQLEQQVQSQQKELSFVRVPVTDLMADALMEAMRRECEVNPHAIAVVNRIQHTAKEIKHGAEVKRRQADAA